MPVCEMVYGAFCQMQLHNLSFDESGANISQILQKNDDYAENIAPSIARLSGPDAAPERVPAPVSPTFHGLERSASAMRNRIY